MKAITLTQPWASLMAFQQKRIETRSWYTSYRGELVIHAAKNFPASDRELCLDDPFYTALRKLRPEELPLSMGLCVVRLLGCIPTNKLHGVEMLLGHKPHVNELKFGNFGPGRYAWVTEYVRPLNAGPVRGSLGPLGLVTFGPRARRIESPPRKGSPVTKALKPADPRHAQLREVLKRYWAAENPDMPELPWGPADADALGTFLRANPMLTVRQKYLPPRLDAL